MLTDKQTPTSDSDLLLRISNDDEKAFGQIFHRHYKRMVMVARRYMTDLDLSENIVQQIFVKLWEQRKNLQINSFEAYLLVSVRNSCNNELKHQKTIRKYENQAIDEPWETDDVYPDNETLEKIYKVIEEMPPQRKKIFKMNRLEGMKYKEIAEALQLSPKTVEVQISKALKYLKENLSYLKLSIYHEN